MRKYGWLLPIASLAVTGCNTMAGMGRDVSYAGNSLVKWSTDLREEIPNTGYEGEQANRLVVTDAEGNIIHTEEVPVEQPAESAVTNSRATSAYRPATSSAQPETYRAIHQPTSQTVTDNGSVIATDLQTDPPMNRRMEYRKPKYYQYGE